MPTPPPDPPVTPPLKWAGGKRWLVPRLREIWHSQASARLVEPFCGGLSVALGLDPARAILNDSNPHLINFYQQLQNGLTVDLEMRNESEAYYEARDHFNTLIREGRAATPEGAQLFYYLNRSGFNGLCRFNQSGFFNVPFGKYRKINYRTDFSRYARAIGAWDFRCGDFGQLNLDAGDFIYADPPYDVEFTTYSAGGFDWEDQERLAVALAKHPGPVVLSNQLTPRVEALYIEQGYSLEVLDAPRRISCTGDRSPAKEVLAIRNLDAMPSY